MAPGVCSRRCRASIAHLLVLAALLLLAQLDALRMAREPWRPALLVHAARQGDVYKRQELQAIASALKGDPARDLVFGAQATRESVLEANRSGRLAKKRVLAFATHGLLPGDLPGLSQPALALSSTAGAEADPLAPVLKLDDVLGLRLNADWVVLSACNSASADGKAEEALSGLARGFFYAGTRSLLVTHWAVDSDSAGLLTAWTFEHHAANPQSAKACLLYTSRCV